MARKRLGELLVMAGVIDEFQLQSALGEQRRWGRPLGVTLVEMGLVNEKTLVKLLSTQLNIPTIDLERVDLEDEAVRMLDFDLCSEYQCIPFRYEEHGKFLHIAMADPTSIEIFDRIRVHTRCNLRPHLAGGRSIEAAIRRRYLGVTTGRDDDSSATSSWVQRPEEETFNSIGGTMPQDPASDAAAPERPKRTPSPDPSRRTPLSEQHAAVAPSASVHFDEALLRDVLRELKEVKAMLNRDEMVLRKVMSLIVTKGLCTREELISRLQED